MLHACIRKFDVTGIVEFFLESERALHRGLGGSHRELHLGLIIPTGPVKLSSSGSGLPDRFDRKPVETG